MTKGSSYPMSRVVLLILLWLACSGCASNKSSLVAQTPSPPEPFVRVNSSSNRIDLQIAVRQFRPVKARGPSIWLSGVSHIAEPEYYEAIQKHLAERSVVLYEGISARRPAESPRSDRVSQPTPADVPPSPRRAWDLQSSL